MREIPNLPEGRAPREPLDLLRERERAQRFSRGIGGIALASIVVSFLMRYSKEYIEVRSKKFDHEPDGPTISRLYFRLQRFLWRRHELRIITALLLFWVYFTEPGRKSLYRVLVQSSVRIDRRYPYIKAVRRLYGIIYDSQPDVENLDLQGVDLSELYLHQANFANANLSRANLTSTYLRKADLSESNLDNAILSDADLRATALIKVKARGVMANRASFVNAHFSNADWEGANLENSVLDGAVIEKVNLRSANLRQASLIGTRIIGCDLRQADLTETNLRHADLVDCNVTSCILQGAYVYGTAAWDLRGVPTNSGNLIITPEGEPEVIVDDLEVAQLLYLLLYDSNVRRVIDAVTSSVVLILGRFTEERMPVLELIRSELRGRGYSPVLFNFEKPANRDLTETISTLAHLARFVIADITDARSVPQELGKIIPNLPSVPVQPILQAGSAEYTMFEHLKRYPWVLPISEYVNSAGLLHSLRKAIIEPAEAFLSGQG